MIQKVKAIINAFGGEETVLIYQMGKVGSTSLELALSDVNHFHTLYDNPPCYIHRERRSRFRHFLKMMGSALKRLLIRRRKRVKIVSLVREPYGRNVSMFFQDLPYWMIKYQEINRYDSREEGLGFLFDTFNEVYDHRYFDSWFDRELKRLTGIDIFTHPFDRERGCQVICQGRYEVMLIKLEKMASLQSEIEAFVGYPFEMRQSNVGEQKWYACLYREFRERYTPANAYLEGLYDTRTVRHFYSDEEIEGFRQKYLGRAADR